MIVQHSNVGLALGLGVGHRPRKSSVRGVDNWAAGPGRNPRLRHTHVRLPPVSWEPAEAR